MEYSNEILESLYNRKSVRVYVEKEIPEEAVDAILKAAMQAPTAGNMMLYSIIRVSDKEKKERLSKICDNQPWIAKSPLVLLFLADYHRWQTAFRSAVGEETRKLGLGDLLLATSDALIAAENAVTAAESLGIGSCYIGDILENFEETKELLSLPEEVAPVAMLCLGYPTKQQRERMKPLRFDRDMILFENEYPKDISEIAQRQGTTEKVSALCKRKFTGDFSLEMNRSAQEIYKNWSKQNFLRWWK